jgi:hypothetical protein
LFLILSFSILSYFFWVPSSPADQLRSCHEPRPQNQEATSLSSSWHHSHVVSASCADRISRRRHPSLCSSTWPWMSEVSPISRLDGHELGKGPVQYPNITPGAYIGRQPFRSRGLKSRRHYRSIRVHNQP